jgi:WD40 repeat protein
MLRFRDIINEAPIQISSLLVFCPTSSIIRQTFRCRVPKWIKQEPSVPNNWGSSLLVLEGHKSTTSSVVFSSDGALLASSADNGEIRLWNTVTGEARGVIRRLRARPARFSIREMAFSPDNQFFAYTDIEFPLIEIWDIKKRKVLKELWLGYNSDDLSHSNISMAFSHDQGILFAHQFSNFQNRITFWYTSCFTDDDYKDIRMSRSVQFSIEGQLKILAEPVDGSLSEWARLETLERTRKRCLSATERLFREKINKKVQPCTRKGSDEELLTLFSISTTGDLIKNPHVVYTNHPGSHKNPHAPIG